MERGKDYKHVITGNVIHVVDLASDRLGGEPTIVCYLNELDNEGMKQMNYELASEFIPI